MKPGSITIKDIAKALGLSFSTVSRALKDSYMISEPIRKKVKEYAEANHYRPNMFAKSLRSNKSRSIGLILPSIPNSFFAEVISGIEEAAFEKEYKVIICQSNESNIREQRNIEHLIWQSVDGILLSLSTESTDISYLKQIQQEGLPIVLLDRISAQIDTHSVTVNNKQATYDVISYLISKGYRQIAHITSNEESYITKERRAGHLAALADHHLSADESLFHYCRHGGMEESENQSAIESLLKLTTPPDAIFTASDRLTIATLRHLHKLNIKIPDQIAIAGFSNFSAPELLNPSLTIIRQPAFEMGKMAMELLIELIESKKPVKDFKQAELPATLINTW